MRYIHILYTILYASLALFLLLSLLSYNPEDPSLLYVSLNEPTVTNWCGAYGAHISSLMLYLFGGAALIFIPAFIVLSTKHIISSLYDLRKESIIVLFLIVPAFSLFFHSMHKDVYASILPGGICGQLLTVGFSSIIDRAVLPIIIFFMIWGMLVFLTGFSWVRPFMHAMQKVVYALHLDTFTYFCLEKIISLYAYSMSIISAHMRKIKSYVWKGAEVVKDEFDSVLYDTAFWQPHINPVQEPSENVLEEYQNLSGAAEHTLHTPLQEETIQTSSVEESLPLHKKYVKPDVSTFKQRSNEPSQADRYEQQNQSHILEEKLKRFGIKGSVLNITAGPVVTLFEYQPQIDVPISRIIAREDDLALALQAVSLRIIAPIPGKSVIGFEVSNVARKTVFFSDSVNSKEFIRSDAQLPLIVGQNTIGEQTIIDLTKMPHLLVAGSTGSGKSVALNTMLLSLLCKATPEEVRMILIDPKRLEFAAYADIPHLLFPIVTDPKVAMTVLQWAIATMEKRYETMAAAGVRNIYDYRALPEGPMPYIVIVIDELADLMMVAGKDMEAAIARLAQMARAGGIHLVLATQRPSVDVITGVVKVNFPARLACKVTSKIDSRTILDTGGAEKLLGKGDMLFLDPQGKLSRFHGAYVTDQEIASVVAQVKEQCAVAYEQLPTQDKDCTLQGEDALLYKELVDFVKTVDEVSISLLQRRFRIGYNRSARLIDILEARGIIMPSSGSRTRKVLH